MKKKAVVSKVASASGKKRAEWTILVYMAGDNDLDDFGGDDLLEMKAVGSSDQRHIVVQRDTAAAGVPSKRYRVRADTPQLEDDVVSELGETNMGDPSVLADFLDWGIKKYPAERTMVVLWNHGAGWDDTDIYAEARRRGLVTSEVRTPSVTSDARRSGVRDRMVLPAGWVRRSAAPQRYRGPFFLTAFQTTGSGAKRRAIAFDDDAQDFLDSVEMKNVLKSAAAKLKSRKFDIIGMDACLMSMVETGMQVQSAGKLFCGSQEVEPGQGWPYDRILQLLAVNPLMSAEELSKVIVEQYVKSYPKRDAVTQSAFDLGRLLKVQTAVDALGSKLTTLWKKGGFAVQGAIGHARHKAQGYEHPDYVDLVDFCLRLESALPAIKSNTTKVRSAVSQCVVINRAPHSAVANSHGLSIYLPKDDPSPLYQKLDFAKGGWGKFLSERMN